MDASIIEMPSAWNSTFCASLNIFFLLGPPLSKGENLLNKGARTVGRARFCQQTKAEDNEPSYYPPFISS